MVKHTQTIRRSRRLFRLGVKVYGNTVFKAGWMKNLETVARSRKEN